MWTEGFVHWHPTVLFLFFYSFIRVRFIRLLCLLETAFIVRHIPRVSLPQTPFFFLKRPERWGNGACFRLWLGLHGKIDQEVVWLGAKEEIINGLVGVRGTSQT